MLKLSFGLFLIFNILNFVFAKLGGESVISTKAYAIWPNATVPFYVNPSHFDHEQTTSILTALSVFAYKTCIKFKPVMARPFPTDEVMVFINPDGTRRCQIETKGHSAFNPHLVKLGYECIKSPHIDMMIMRALGFPFEHNRDNRDLYIDVLQENVEPGAIELFTKEDTLPLELRFLPYDINSVMHFSNREYSKNGHRTIIFKDPTARQNRVGLTETDLRKIEIVYGAECRARDRQDKIDLCQSYPGVARRKRQADDLDVDSKDQNISLVKRKKRDTYVETETTKSLRINPDITPPPENLTEDITNTLNELGIEDEVEEIVEKVYKVSSLALKNAREKYCNNSEAKPLTPRDVKEKKTHRNNSDILGIIEVVAEFAKGMVDDAIKNLTKFCEVSDAIEAYQRYHCDLGGRDPRCRMTYRSTKSGAVRYSTQHRPLILQSTKHYGQDKARVQYGREGDAKEAETEVTQTTKLSDRKKREIETMTEVPVEEKKENTTTTTEVKFRADDKNTTNDTNETKAELSEMAKLVQSELQKEAPNNETQEVPKEEEKDTEADGNKVDVHENKKDKSEEADNLKSVEIVKINNKEIFRMGTIVPGSRGESPYRRSHHYRAESEESSKELDDLDKILAKKIIDKKLHMGSNGKKYPKDKEIEETRQEIKEKAKRHHRHKKAQLNEHIAIPTEQAVEDKKIEHRYKQTEDQAAVEVVKPKRSKKRSKLKSKRDKLKYVEKLSALNADDEETAESAESPEEIVKRPSKPRRPIVQPAISEEEPAGPEDHSLPRTVTLSEKNKEFYNERRWLGGEVVYVIQVDTTYDISDMRQRLAEVNDILKEKTCASLREVKPEEAEGYEDYLVIDNSPDYVTGRVGGQQRFGSIELFRGGQHRQHAAMMVMAMLGFYFEVSRHDRDKYIRVHMRHVRPDKLHHFEMIRSDATLPLPYDYASATHPAWQFWRQIGRSGISTVATFKQNDPDGSIMKSLGQNEKLLSDLDIVKINSVYGTDCFAKNALRNKNTAMNALKNKTEIVKSEPVLGVGVKTMLQKK